VWCLILKGHHHSVQLGSSTHNFILVIIFIIVAIMFLFWILLFVILLPLLVIYFILSVFFAPTLVARLLCVYDTYILNHYDYMCVCTNAVRFIWFITTRCNLVQSAVLRSHVCLSVCPSVTLVDCDHIGWNSSEIISPSVSLGVHSLQPKHHGSTPRGTPWNFRPNRGGVLKKWLSAYKSSNI